MQEANSVNKDQVLNSINSEVIALLKELIAVPSFSIEENGTANIIEKFFHKKGMTPKRKGNNVWVKNKYFS